MPYRIRLGAQAIITTIEWCNRLLRGGGFEADDPLAPTLLDQIDTEDNDTVTWINSAVHLLQLIRMLLTESLEPEDLDDLISEIEV